MNQGRNQKFLIKGPDHCAKNSPINIYRNILSRGGPNPFGPALVTDLQYEHFNQYSI